jgi:hypothetical protein
MHLLCILVFDPSENINTVSNPIVQCALNCVTRAHEHTAARAVRPGHTHACTAQLRGDPWIDVRAWGHAEHIVRKFGADMADIFYQIWTMIHLRSGIMRCCVCVCVRRQVVHGTCTHTHTRQGEIPDVIVDVVKGHLWLRSVCAGLFPEEWRPSNRHYIKRGHNCNRR